MSERNPLVVIFGCGPSGLLAAHACSIYGIQPIIFSLKQKSILGGAQYSHIPIPILNDEEPEVLIQYEAKGTPEEYRSKVYGDLVIPFVSFPEEGRVAPAWNLRAIYEKLWEQWGDQVIDVNQIDGRLAQRFNASPVFDLIFNTIPLTVICQSTVTGDVHHTFRSQTVRIYNEAIDTNLADNTIRYDGTSEHSYYRMSRIFGVGSTEWSVGSPVPPLQGLRTVSKPIGTDCDCYPNILRIGRFGTWKKGILTSHAFNAVLDTLHERGYA